MYSKKDINDLTNLITKAISPIRIILFGSYAYGTPTINSDVDLMVIVADKNLTMDKKADLSYTITKTRESMQKYISTDISILSEEEIKYLQFNENSSVCEAMKKGRVLYDINVQKS